MSYYVLGMSLRPGFFFLTACGPNFIGDICFKKVVESQRMPLNLFLDKLANVVDRYTFLGDTFQKWDIKYKIAYNLKRISNMKIISPIL